MRFLKENIVAILLIIVVVFVTLQLTAMFRNSSPDEKLIRLDEQAKHKEELRLRDSVHYSGLIQSKDSIISVLLQRTNEKQIQYVQLKNDEKKIRPTVESYSSSELLRRANGWQPN